MRISDWSSDVCSSDLRRAAGVAIGGAGGEQGPVQHPFDIHDAGADGCQFGDDLLGRGRWRGRVRKRRDASFHAALKHGVDADALLFRSEEHTSELQSLMRISYAVFCLKKNT